MHVAGKIHITAITHFSDGTPKAQINAQIHGAADHPLPIGTLILEVPAADVEDVRVGDELTIGAPSTATTATKVPPTT